MFLFLILESPLYFPLEFYFKYDFRVILIQYNCEGYHQKCSCEVLIFWVSLRNFDLHTEGLFVPFLKKIFI